MRLRAACRALGVGEITAHGLRHSAATILLNQVGKDLREIQELLRHKNIRTTVRYTHVGYEQTRQTAEALSTAFVESTINQVVSKRFVKKQQMQWTPRGAHLLLQTRTKVLNNDLEDVFRGWYPQFHARAA